MVSPLLRREERPGVARGAWCSAWAPPEGEGTMHDFPTEKKASRRCRFYGIFLICGRLGGYAACLGGIPGCQVVVGRGGQDTGAPYPVGGRWGGEAVPGGQGPGQDFVCDRPRPAGCPLGCGGWAGGGFSGLAGPAGTIRP